MSKHSLSKAKTIIKKQLLDAKSKREIKKIIKDLEELDKYVENYKKIHPIKTILLKMGYFLGIIKR